MDESRQKRHDGKPNKARETLLGEELHTSRSSHRPERPSYDPQDEEAGLLAQERRSAEWLKDQLQLTKKKQPRQGKSKEAEFEEQALALIRRGNELDNEEVWLDLENFSCDHLDSMNGKNCPKGFFYLGVALYKMSCFEQAINAFEKCINLDKKDAQAHYNLALAHFKVRNYDDCERSLIKCRDLNPKHRYAWNNLAFIYNLFGLYQ